MSVPERSSPAFENHEKFSKWVFFSFLFHLALIAGLFIIQMLPSRQAPEYPVYTVDLVGGEKIGRTNFGTELKSSPAVSSPAAREAPKKEPPAPVPETKREVKKEKTEKIEKAEKPKLVEKTPVEKSVLLPDKFAKKEIVKKKEPSAETKSDAKTETAALENVRQRLIQSAVERVKNRTESGQKPSKGEEISAGTGEGRGAAALGPGGTGGGVVKGIDFLRYQSQIFSTIKSNWVWVGQKGNLSVRVYFSIKDNGEIVGLKLVQTSGNASYDDSVLRAVRKSSPLPPPPETVRKDASDVDVIFRPEDLGA